MITTCTKCGRPYDDPSEESANEPNRTCLACELATLKAQRDELLSACQMVIRDVNLDVWPEVCHIASTAIAHAEGRPQ